MTGFVAKREARWEYAVGCVHHIEDHNCILGCTKAIEPTRGAPGGSCEVLLRICLEQPCPEIIDDGVHLHCTARTP